MWIRPFAACPEFIAGDSTVLRELLNGPRDRVAARYSLAHARLPEGQWSRRHALESTEVYYILAGHGRMEIDGETADVHPGDTIYIPPKAQQRIFSSGPGELQFLCLVDPAWRAEDETVFEEKS